MRLVKLDIGNPVALAPAQAGLFILANGGCRRASEQRRLHVLECVDADNGVEAAVDLAEARRPSQAMTRPGNPAPTMGPGTLAVIEPWRMA
jgi:hypothetical protein